MLAVLVTRLLAPLMMVLRHTHATFSHFTERNDIKYCISEYMLGDFILVAPVMEPGKLSRDVYLPAGIWEDMNTGMFQEGPILIKDYPAPLDVLPYFRGGLVSSSSHVFSAITTLVLAIFASLLV
jgi:alpha-glucosidase (family GH31 glycosyl hydrolase)